MNCIFFNSDCKGKLNYRMPLAAIEKSAAMCEYHWTLRQHDVRVAASTKCTCWEGYERVPGTKPCAPGSCRKKSSREAGIVGDTLNAINTVRDTNPALWDIGVGFATGTGVGKWVEKKIEKHRKKQDSQQDAKHEIHRGEIQQIKDFVGMGDGDPEGYKGRHRASFNQVVSKTMFALNYLEKVAHSLPPHLAGFFKNIRERAHEEGVHLICNFDNCDLMKNAHQKGNHRYCTSGLCDKYDKSMFKTYWQRLIGIQHEMGYHTACDAESCAPKRDSHNIGLHDHCGVECPDAPNDVEVAQNATEPFSTPEETTNEELTKTTKKIAFVPSTEQLEQIRTAAHDRKVHLLCDFINCEEMDRGHQAGNHNICTPSNCDKYDRLGFSTLWLKLKALEHNMGFHHLCDPSECSTRKISHETGKHEFCGPECPSTFDLNVPQNSSQNSGDSDKINLISHKLAVNSTHPFGFVTPETSFDGKIDDRDGTSVPKNIFTVSEDSEPIGRPSAQQREKGFTEEVESLSGTDDDDNPPTDITDEVEADSDDDEQDTNTRDAEDEARQGRDK